MAFKEDDLPLVLDSNCDCCWNADGPLREAIFVSTTYVKSVRDCTRVLYVTSFESERRGFLASGRSLCKADRNLQIQHAVSITLQP